MTRCLRVLAGAPAALGVLALLSGCSSSGQPDRSSSPATSASPSATASAEPGTKSDSSGSATLTIKDFEYSGATTVAPATRITVENIDSEAHTVTAGRGSAFDVKVDPGASATFTAPSKVGTYSYHCTFHANMQGTLRVG